MSINTWKHHVIITRADGEVRTLPLGMWNELLAARLLEEGAQFELPEQSLESEITRGRTVERPDRSEQDQNLVDLLSSLENILNDEQMAFVEKLEDRLSRSRCLTVAQRQQAELLLDRLERLEHYQGDQEFNPDPYAGRSLAF